MNVDLGAESMIDESQIALLIGARYKSKLPQTST